MTPAPETSQSIGPFVEAPGIFLDPGIRHIEPILYGDIFDYPLTLEEIWRYCPMELSREELAERLAVNGLVENREGLYYLEGRGELVDLRRRRKQESEAIWKHAVRVAGLIRNVPWLKSMAITGSLATDNSDSDGDPDFLVITARKRIWTVFFFLGTIQKLTSTHTLCPNFYIAEHSLGITPRDFYNAREVAQAIPLVGAGLFDRFLDANPWVDGFVPNHRNSARRESPELRRHGLLRLLGRTFELITAGFIGDGLERLFRRLLFHRLPHHYLTFGGEAPGSVLEAARQGRELRFHGLHHRTMIRNAIAERVERLQVEPTAQGPIG